MSEKKKVPNPNGRKGGDEHQSVIGKIIKSIFDRGLGFRTEAPVKLKNGSKRYADVAALDPNGNAVEYYQAGKQNQDGTPVKRERDAIADIEKATGIKVIFTPYNVTIALLIFSGIMLCFYRFYLY